MILERVLITVEIMLHIIRQVDPLIQVRVRVVVRSMLTVAVAVQQGLYIRRQEDLVDTDAPAAIIMTAPAVSPHHYTMILGRALMTVEIILHIIRQVTALIRCLVTIVRITRNGAIQHA
jgi:hypothetical protein